MRYRLKIKGVTPGHRTETWRAERRFRGRIDGNGPSTTETLKYRMQRHDPDCQAEHFQGG